MIPTNEIKTLRIRAAVLGLVCGIGQGLFLLLLMHWRVQDWAVASLETRLVTASVFALMFGILIYERGKRQLRDKHGVSAWEDQQ